MWFCWVLERGHFVVRLCANGLRYTEFAAGRFQCSLVPLWYHVAEDEFSWLKRCFHVIFGTPLRHFEFVLPSSSGASVPSKHSSLPHVSRHFGMAMEPRR